MFYNAFMLGLVAAVSNRYFVETDKETGAGRADLMLIPKPNAKHRNAVVMEFKSVGQVAALADMANAALEQIKNKNYTSKIKTYENVSSVISIGIAFCCKDVEVAYSSSLLSP